MISMHLIQVSKLSTNGKDGSSREVEGNLRRLGLGAESLQGDKNSAKSLGKESPRKSLRMKER